MKLIAVAASALVAGCSLAGSWDLPNSVWAINESTNHYVVRATDGDAWDLPPNSGGFVMERSDTVDVLDATNCAVVATDRPATDILVTVDRQGRVDFVPQYEQPRLGELQPTTTCAARPTNLTTS